MRILSRKIALDLLNLLLFTLLFGSYYLHFHSYSMTRPESLLFFLVLFLGLLAPWLLCRLLKCDWVFYAPLLILSLDLSLGIFYSFYLFCKSAAGGSKEIAYTSIFFFGFFLFFIGFHIRSRIQSIARVLFLTTLLLTVVTYPFSSNPFIRVSHETRTPSPVPGNKPDLFFIILDEHIGIDGIPLSWESGKRLKETLIQNYGQNGFLLFTKAYSNNGFTGNSIPGILNSKVVLSRQGVFEKGVLLQNRLLEKLYREGYRINVYQSNFMDFTRSPDIPIRKSMTYNMYSMGLLQAAPLPVTDKLLILSANFAESYHSQPLKKISLALFKHDWKLLSHLASEPVFREIAADLNTSPRNTVFFVHLLMPHYPYAYGDDGRILKPALWEANDCSDCGKDMRNTVEGRQKKYLLYFNQVRHLYEELNQLFEQARRLGIYEESSFVLISDHGSRISLNLMDANHASQLTPQDYTDMFASFVAVKKGAYNPSFYKDRGPLIEDELPTVKIIGEFFSLALESDLSRPELTKVYLSPGPEGDDTAELDPAEKEMVRF